MLRVDVVPLNGCDMQVLKFTLMQNNPKNKKVLFFCFLLLKSESAYASTSFPGRVGENPGNEVEYVKSSPAVKTTHGIYIKSLAIRLHGTSNSDLEYWF